MAPSTRAESVSGFRHFLADRFEAAQRQNPRYSLRAFARQLAIDHATLSQVLRGRRPITRKAVRRIGAKLGLSEPLISFYARRLDNQNGAVAGSPAVQLSLDTFHVISDWYHAAISELVHLRNFRPDSRWIARSLGITVNEVNIALQRLLRLGLLQMVGAKWIARTACTNLAREELMPEVRKKVRAEGHRRAMAAIEGAPEERVAQHSITLAIDSKDLPRFDQLAYEFLGSVKALLGDASGKNGVYQFQLSAFPLTTCEKEVKKHG